MNHKCDHIYLKGKPEEGLGQTHRVEDRRQREGNVTMEVEIGLMQPQCKECLDPPEAGKVKEQSFWKEHSPSDTLISDFRPTEL